MHLVNEGTITTAFSTSQTPMMLQYLWILLKEYLLGVLIAEKIVEILLWQIVLLNALDAFIAEVCINDIMNKGEDSRRGHFDSIICAGMINRMRWRLWPENPAAERIDHQLYGSQLCAKKKE